MEELTSRSASSSSLASRASTIASSAPSALRTMRPYAPGSAGSNESTVAAAPSPRWVSSSRPSSSPLIAPASPVTTSTSPSNPASASRAAAAASPVPRGSAWTATSTPSKASSEPAEVTTTSGSGLSSRAASTTQSTSRRPSSGCRCLGVSERMRLPSPAARTPAARRGSVTGLEMAGAPGFEPGIAGPKPAALPLGYAPPKRLGAQDRVQHGRAGKARSASNRRRERRLSTWLRPTETSWSPRSGGTRPSGQSPIGLQPASRATPQHLATPHHVGASLASVDEQEQKGNGGEDPGDHEGQPRDHERQDYNDDRQRLRGGGDPGDLPHGVRARLAAPDQVERQQRHRHDDHRPAGKVLLEGDDQ